MDIFVSSSARVRQTLVLGTRVVSLCAAIWIAGGHVVAQVSSQGLDSNLVQDEDGDGLSDQLEAGQNSSTDRVDSDNDGWNDAEELARGTIPTVFSSQPGVEPEADLGIRTYQRGGKLRAAFAIWVRSGTLGDIQLDVGIGLGARIVPLAPSSYLSTMVVNTVPTREGGRLLLVADVAIPNTPMVRFGSMSVIGKLRIGNEVLAADCLNLKLRSGVPTEIITPSQISPLANELLGPGILYRPLGGTQVPITWSSGEICFQQLSPVGTHGPVVTQEVTSSSCISGWDGYCDATSCASSVGTTVDLVDPAALTGG